MSSNEETTGGGEPGVTHTTEKKKEYKGRRAFNMPTTIKTLPKPKFEGRVTDLNGHIYDCSNYQQADTYTRTTKEIAEYVGRTYKFGSDIRLAIEGLSQPTWTEPADPLEGATRTQVRIWEKDVDEFVKRKNYFNENAKTAYSLVWGQCTDAMRAKLEARNDHVTVAANGDVLGLLQNIKDATFNFQNQKYKPHALHEAKRRFYLSTQDKNATCQAYLERFKNHIEVIEHCGGTVDEKVLIDDELILNGVTRNSASSDELSQATTTAREQYMACAFLVGSDRDRYGKLVEDLENDHIQGSDKYPKTLTNAYSLLVHWKQSPKNLMRALGGNNDGLAFTNAHESEAGEKGNKVFPDIKCHNCNKMGHYAGDCREEKKKEKTKNAEASGTTLLLNAYDFDDGPSAFSFHQESELMGDCYSQSRKLPRSWILLDNQSTVDVFMNKDLLDNIRTVATTMNIRCNAGNSRTNLQGDLRGYGTV